jgi:hypothetical protein
MTEQEWLASNDLAALLEFIRDKASYRKLRLFLCGWCRLNWDQFVPQCQAAVEMGELLADRLVSDSGTKAVFWSADSASRRTHSTSMNAIARLALVDDEELWKFAHGPARAKPKAKIRQAALLRDLIGNPFRPIVLQPTWLTWNEGTVPRIAKAIYDDRAFDRLPVLADALMDAGCTDSGILDHCQCSGPHVRGCFVVDLLLNKV